MVWIYLILNYLITWIVTFVAVKLDNSRNYRDNFSWEQKNIIYQLKNGSFWWLVFPIVGIVASIVFLIIGVVSYTNTQKFIDKKNKLIEFVFGKY